MFNLPPLPKVYNTRHLTCVACKEKFVISEGTERKRQEIPSVALSIRVRYDDNRQQLPVFPSPRSSHQPQSSFFQPNPLFQEEEINCPRCGTDNRNWLYLINYPNRQLLGSSLLGSLEIWLQRMRGIFILAVMFIVIFVLMVLSAAIEILPKAQAFSLTFIAVFAIYGVFWDLTYKWKKYREDKLLYDHKLTKQNPSSTVLRRGIFLIVFFSFFVPLFFVSLLPRGFDFVTTIVHEAPEETVTKTISNIGQLSNERLEESRESLLTIREEMQSLLTRVPTQVSPQFEQELDAFSQELDAVVTEANNVLDQSMSDGLASLEARREEEMATIASATEVSMTDFRENFLAELRLLVVWGSLLGVATLITVIVAYSNLADFIKRINAQLPLPIFHSVAGMTRLVIWEAKKALELEGNMQHIQWVKVERNTAGGINLTGLHRDPPSFNAQGQAFGETVRAQKYVIQTDMWGRIVKASIYDTRVPRPAGGPGFVTITSVPHDAPLHLRPPKDD